MTLKDYVGVQGIFADRQKRERLFIAWLAKQGTYHTRHKFDEEVYELGLKNMEGVLK